MKRGLLGVVLSIGLALAACGKKEPSGQVVATVGKEEITAIDLRNEMGGFSTPDPKVRRNAEQAALNQIVMRKVLAQAAKKAKVDKTPEFAQQEKRLREALLVQAWQNQLARAVPPASKEEVDKFIADHPDFYAAHKVFVVDQIRMPRNVSPDVLKALQPLNSMPEIEAALTNARIQFAKGTTEVDSLTMSAETLAQLMKLPPGEVFILPANNLFLINQIRETKVAPVTGQIALNHAAQYLKAARTREALQRAFGSAAAQGRKDVKFAKAYQPPAPAKSGAQPPPKAAPAAK